MSGLDINPCQLSLTFYWLYDLRQIFLFALRSRHNSRPIYTCSCDRDIILGGDKVSAILHSLVGTTMVYVPQMPQNGTL